MKLASTLGLAILVIAAVAIGLIFFRSANAPGETDVPTTTLVEESSAVMPGEFLRLAPSDLPPVISPTDETDTENVASPIVASYNKSVQATISIKDDGFVPADLTIAAGTEVVFVNNGQAAHWPASAVHPTHTSYPGSDIKKCETEEASSIFDACRGLITGESYVFKFNQPGVWQYHDHLRANLGGSITVTAADE